MRIRKWRHEHRPPPKCMFCAIGRCEDCDHHINDGAVDALDFIDVYCECDCNGGIYRPDDPWAHYNDCAAAADDAIDLSPDQSRWVDGDPDPGDILDKIARTLREYDGQSEEAY